MADKQITMVLKVDLECERCNKKIKSVLQKIKDEMNIKATSYDEKRNLVTISGPLDAEKVRRKLCCAAGRIIKGMEEVKRPKEDVRKPPAVAVDLGPLLAKMLPQPRTKPPPCTCTCCSCRKQSTGVPAKSVASVLPTSVSAHACNAPSSCYGVPVYSYSIEGWYC